MQISLWQDTCKSIKIKNNGGTCTRTEAKPVKDK